MLKVVPIRGLAYSIFILSTLFFITMVTFFFLEIAALLAIKGGASSCRAPHNTRQSY